MVEKNPRFICKKDIEKIYRSVTFYNNKPKLGSPKPIVVEVNDENDEE